MDEKYAYRASGDKWIDGFETRQAAIDAAKLAGLTNICTASTAPDTPAHFARFFAEPILVRMIAGLIEGERTGKLIGSASAVEALTPIANASISDNFPGNPTKEWELQLDLMNRLQAAVGQWIEENGIDFNAPRFVNNFDEQLHVAGTTLNVPIL